MVVAAEITPPCPKCKSHDVKLVLKSTIAPGANNAVFVCYECNHEFSIDY